MPIRSSLALFGICLALALIAAAAPMDTALIATAAAIVGTFLFFKPDYAIYLMIAIVVIGGEQPHFIFFSSWASSIDRISVLLPLVVFCGIIRLLLDYASGLRAPIVRSKLHILFFVLIVWARLSIYWARNPYHARVQLMVLVLNILLYYLVAQSIGDIKIHRKFFRALVASGVLVTLLAYYLRFSAAFRYFGRLARDLKFQLLIPGKTWRLTALGWSQNDLALVLNFIIPIAFGMFLIEKNKSTKALLLFSTLLMISGVFLTMTRGAVFAMFITLHFYFLASSILRKKIIRNFVLAYGAIITIFVGQLYLIAEERGSRVLAIGGQGWFGISSRLKLWTTGFTQLFSFEGFGMGVGGFSNLTKPSPHAHSIYFDYLFDFGLLGVLIPVSIFLLLAGIMIKSLESRQTDYIHVMSLSALAGLLSIAIHGTVDFGYNSAHVWLFFGLSMATFHLSRITKQESPGTLPPAAEKCLAPA